VIAPAKARDGIVCRGASEIIVKFSADNVGHNHDLPGAHWVCACALPRKRICPYQV